jgi:hypothetical protein
MMTLMFKKINESFYIFMVGKISKENMTIDIVSTKINNCVVIHINNG